MQIIAIIGIITYLSEQNHFYIEDVLLIIAIPESGCIYITCIVFTLVSLILGCK